VKDELTARFEKIRLAPGSTKPSSVKELKKEYEDILSESKVEERPSLHSQVGTDAK